MIEMSSDKLENELIWFFSGFRGDPVELGFEVGSKRNFHTTL